MTVAGKVFGIGLSRTGTRSLAAALSVLGYRAGHYDVSARAVGFDIGGVTPDHELIAPWDALTDIPVALVYRDLDRHYEGARFVLTVREESAWLDSCERHYAADRTDWARRNGIDLERIVKLREAMYGQSFFTREGFRAAYARHVAGVRDHFAGKKSSLLELDICHGAGWPELCGFLRRAAPAIPFPRENASSGRR